MSTINEQSVFLLHVAELINKAISLGFLVSGGELYRTPEQQALHVKNGRSTTMNSQHLKRLAIDLNFFRPDADGTPKLTYAVEDLRPLGQFWEGLDPANRWGGNWSSFKDTPHFERRDSSAPNTPGSATPTAAGPGAVPLSPAPLAATVTSGSRTRGSGLLQQSVGARCPNQRDDVESVQRLLNLSAAEGVFSPTGGPLKCDGAFGNKTLQAICDFQRQVLGNNSPDGCVERDGSTLYRLCSVLAPGCDAGLLSLLYLRADDGEINALAASISQAMANRNIDTPLRQAHFLAQIGHESGELRFRSELASGEAYEGRLDLGNSEPGDGPRYKGRGLIQLTGRANYTEYGKALGRMDDLLAHPEQVADDAGLCVDVAAWFWSRRELNALADRDDLSTITRRINGGLNGLDDRRRLLLRGKSLLGL